jgi:hypothetical protein
MVNMMILFISVPTETGLRKEDENRTTDSNQQKQTGLGEEEDYWTSDQTGQIAGKSESGIPTPAGHQSHGPLPPPKEVEWRRKVPLKVENCCVLCMIT